MAAPYALARSGRRRAVRGGLADPTGAPSAGAGRKSALFDLSAAFYHVIICGNARAPIYTDENEQVLGH